MTTPTKTREEIAEHFRQERAAARAQFGDRNVTDVLLRVRTRLHMLSAFCVSQSESDSDVGVDAWVGLGDIVDDVVRDVAMLDDALPADVHNWRPGQEGPDGWETDEPRSLGPR
jgi:hypothetical protein